MNMFSIDIKRFSAQVTDEKKETNKQTSEK